VGSSRNLFANSAIFERSTWLAAPPEAVFAFHENPGNLARISPPLLRLRRIEADPVAIPGTRFRIVARPLGLPLDWTGEWLAIERPRRLVDGVVQAPFARFDHEHCFEPEGNGTRMTDRVTYALLGPGWGFLGRLMNRLVAAFVLIPMFRMRHVATRRYFAGN